MKKNSQDQHSKVIILADHEKIDAEEYVEDMDHVYRKKEEVSGRFKFNSSNFWLRIACFFGLIAMAFIIILKFVKLLIALIMSALEYFKNKLLNAQVKGCLKEIKNVGMILAGLAVGVINPKWGMRLMSLFFSLTNQPKTNPFFAA